MPTSLSKSKKLTLFSLPKPFQGHIGIIQRNAIHSWVLLHPECDIILFGDEPGTREAAEHFKIRNIPNVKRNEFCTPLVDDLFKRAQEVSQYDILCYINADIILTSSLLSAIDQVSDQKFLIVGRRWNLDVAEELDFKRSDWENELRLRARREGKLFTDAGIDYFIFSRGLFSNIPSFAIGRSVWDNWLVYKAKREGAALIDATEILTVVHQNHDYSAALMNRSKDGPWKGIEAKSNLQIAGDLDYCFTIRDTEWRLTKRGLEKIHLTSEQLLRKLTVWMVLNENHIFLRWFVKPILFIRLLVRRVFRWARNTN